MNHIWLILSRTEMEVGHSHTLKLSCKDKITRNLHHIVRTTTMKLEKIFSKRDMKKQV